ncbi:MAG: HEPN domain-containing protein [Rhodothermales bacterium]|nr:HEPN domain-containing protein [Rhodothermales bacterium]
MARARSFLGAAAVLREHGYLADAASRAYYAIFTAARAALLAQDIEARTHNGVRRAFSDQFVRTGAVEEDLGRWFSRAEQFRTLADYDPDALVDPEEVDTLMTLSEAFISTIEALVR